MPEHATVLAAWEGFYVIVGSSGGALIGLQFVVITLIAERRRRTTPGSLGAFGTPTVVHFAGALTVSAIMSAPWHSLVAAAAAIGTCGLAGLVYGGIVFRRARRQTGYEPVWEDWVWHVVFPSGTYVALSTAAFLLPIVPETGAFIIAAAALVLLLIGIHNAWDTVIYIVMSEQPDPHD
jgi:hypothetical protein